MPKIRVSSDETYFAEPEPADEARAALSSTRGVMCLVSLGSPRTCQHVTGENGFARLVIYDGLQSHLGTAIAYSVIRSHLNWVA